MKFYHGTSSTLIFADGCIRSSLDTGILREHFRIKNLDIVFLTISKVSAEFYSKLAVEKYGGKPVVYEAIPNDYDMICNGEIICDTAKIVGIV